jgi:hypothetical protein
MKEPRILVISRNIAAHVLKLLVDPDFLQTHNIIRRRSEICADGRETQGSVFGDERKAPGRSEMEPFVKTYQTLNVRILSSAIVASE